MNFVQGNCIRTDGAQIPSSFRILKLILNQKHDLDSLQKNSDIRTNNIVQTHLTGSRCYYTAKCYRPVLANHEYRN